MFSWAPSLRRSHGCEAWSVLCPRTTCCQCGGVDGTVLSPKATDTPPGLTRGAPTCSGPGLPGAQHAQFSRMCLVTVVDVGFSGGQCLRLAVINSNSNNNELDTHPTATCAEHLPAVIVSDVSCTLTFILRNLRKQVGCSRSGQSFA